MLIPEATVSWLRSTAVVAAILLAGSTTSAFAQETIAITPLGDGTTHEIMGTDIDLAEFGYSSEEYLFSGTASAYVAEGEMGRDGNWTTKADSTAPYVARFFVRRPIDPEKFNGTVHVEWLNVTGGADNAVSWKYGHVEMLRSGTAYIGVAAQLVGSDAAREADPERYGELSHPGDDFSYDIFAQAGAAIRQNTTTILPGLEVKQLIASGESQSATRLTTYLNGVQMHHPDVYDGFLVFSSGSQTAPLRQAPQQGFAFPGPTRIRGDVDKPVLSFQTETELLIITNPPAMFPRPRDFDGDPLEVARQPDTDTFRLWELPGAAHVAAYFYNFGARDDGSAVTVEDMALALIEPTGDKSGQGAPCSVPINADPTPWVFNAALRSLNKWVADGTPPPSAPRVATTSVNGRTVIARDAFGNAMGGIRTPYLDAPAATLNGLGFGEGFCFLNGSTVPFSEEAFRMRYERPEDFLAAWTAATDSAVATGFVLEDDKTRLQSVGEIVSEVPVSEWQPRKP
jgi:hypothetical protein